MKKAKSKTFNSKFQNLKTPKVKPKRTYNKEKIFEIGAPISNVKKLIGLSEAMKPKQDLALKKEIMDGIRTKARNEMKKYKCALRGRKQENQSNQWGHGIYRGTDK